MNYFDLVLLKRLRKEEAEWKTTAKFGNSPEAKWVLMGIQNCLKIAREVFEAEQKSRAGVLVRYPFIPDNRASVLYHAAEMSRNLLLRSDRSKAIKKLEEVMKKVNPGGRHD